MLDVKGNLTPDAASRQKHEKFFAKPFDRRYPFAWWRYIDPYAGFSRLLDWGQFVTGVLHLSVAWEFYQARVRLRANFEKLVQVRAQREIRRSIAVSLSVYGEYGYAIRCDLIDVIERDLLRAMADDLVLRHQMGELQLMSVSRKALYYRIWALWDAAVKYQVDIVHGEVLSATVSKPNAIHTGEHVHGNA